MLGFRETNPGLDDSVELAEVVSHAEVAHEDWLRFLRANNGAIPDANEFAVDGDEGDGGVTAFYSLAEAREMYRKMRNRMDRDLLPIADSEGGNHVCLGLSARRRGVYFWDHETEALWELAPSFSEFLSLLEPAKPVRAEDLERVEVLYVDKDWLEAELARQKK